MLRVAIGSVCVGAFALLVAFEGDVLLRATTLGAYLLGCAIYAAYAWAERRDPDEPSTPAIPLAAEVAAVGLFGTPLVVAVFGLLLGLSFDSA